jgi:hypothetical protein
LLVSFSGSCFGGNSKVSDCSVTVRYCGEGLQKRFFELWK